MEMLIESMTGDALTTVAIGDKYYLNWYNYAYPSWKRYCEKHRIGLFVLRNYSSEKSDGYQKRANWEKLLTFYEIKRKFPKINNICYIDTDFILSPIAPNVFTFYKNKPEMALVSQYKNMPYNDMEVRRRIAFFRHHCYNKKYPLDSALFMNLKDMCEYHRLSEIFDYACTGFFMGNIDAHADFLRDLFYKYDENVKSITDGGDEFHINHALQTMLDIQWLPYSFQALWTHEMAWKYPFLYHYGKNKKELIKQCIEASLMDNYFLHFAGSWHESKMWTEVHILNDPKTILRYEEFAAYCAQPVTGKSVGIIKPDIIRKKEDSMEKIHDNN